MDLKQWNELINCLSDAQSISLDTPDAQQYYTVTMSDELLEALTSFAVYMEKLNSIQVSPQINNS